MYVFCKGIYLYPQVSNKEGISSLSTVPINYLTVVLTKIQVAFGMKPGEAVAAAEAPPPFFGPPGLHCAAGTSDFSLQGHQTSARCKWGEAGRGWESVSGEASSYGGDGQRPGGHDLGVEEDGKHISSQDF